MLFIFIYRNTEIPACAGMKGSSALFQKNKSFFEPQTIIFIF